ncbi:STAS/SEC14 domain-containing protein [Algoriphagus sp. SE2]|uniref:STAS/SEC14 domain-containing protein n=1 Tax=Algoriphagus sp. SE2 TaxID=3141536 RepID=UPI0031CD4758
MVEQLKTYKNGILAIEIIDGFTETDEKFLQKLFEDKKEKGFDPINILIKLDEAKISKSSIKVFFEDIIYTLRNYKQMGHVAVVAHSNILKALVPIDNWFFQRSSKGREERYFDISQLDQAFKFIEKTS